MSSRTLALQNYISQDNLLFSDGHIVHQQTLNDVHDSWAQHLKHHSNADAKIAQLFQAMDDNRQEYAGNMEGFWQTVKKQISWAPSISITDIYNIAEGVVRARRYHLDKLEYDGQQLNPPTKTLPKLVDSWIIWHDKLRQQSKTIAVALSFAPVTRITLQEAFETSYRRSAAPAPSIASLSPSPRKDSGVNKSPFAITQNTPEAGATMPSLTPLVSMENNGPDYSSLPIRSDSHNPMTEPGPPLASSLRIAALIFMTPDSILQTTGSLTNPITHRYRQTDDPLSLSMYRDERAGTSASQLSSPVYRARTLRPPNMPQASPLRVQQPVAGTFATSAIAHNAARILAAGQTEVGDADIPIPSIETNDADSPIPSIDANDGEMSSEISEESDDDRPPPVLPAQVMLQGSAFAPGRFADRY